MKILIVDDDARELRFSFTDLKAEMFYATGEQEASAILAKQPIDLDIILMDGNFLNMDEPVYGPDIVKRFRAAGITTKIIMFSSDDGMIEKGMRAGANGAWSKKELRNQGWEEKFLALCDSLL